MRTIRECRRALCLSAADIAAALGVREFTVYRWERGINTPSVVQALALAKLLHVAVEDIDWPEDSSGIRARERRRLVKDMINV